jgi:outer membrane cobalamin receptor
MPVLLLLAAAPAAMAAAMPDGAAAPDDPSSAPIVVTGRPLGDLPTAQAYDVSTIDRTRIEQVPSGRIEDALADVAGLQLFRRSDSRSANPSADGFTLRGLGGNAASRTLVLLDGVPQADPFFGSVPLSAINPDDIGAIRVIHGGGSGAFGAGAVAGTIDMTSAGPMARPWSMIVATPALRRVWRRTWAMALPSCRASGIAARVSGPRRCTSAWLPAPKRAMKTGRWPCARSRNLPPMSKCRAGSPRSAMIRCCALPAPIPG